MHDVSLATEFLHTVSPFNTLDADELSSMARKLQVAYYPQGKTIFTSSVAADLAIIRKGAVRLLDDSRRFLDKRSEAELFGHRIWFHGEQKEYLAEAEEDCLVWHLPQDAFNQLCERNPALGEYFGSHLKKRVSAAAQVSHTVTQVRDLMKREPVLIENTASIRGAARLMSEQNVSSVLVMQDKVLAGIVTDKDLRQRVLAADLDPGEPIARVMTEDPMTLSSRAGVDEALLLIFAANAGLQPEDVVEAHEVLSSRDGQLPPQSSI